ncbi:unnamed protein product [Diatraea saccharalis]|uniref:Uncharacterized protein n=1 Tax=Diatraea saccharalis TaxID=40085 RepID=A0A9N9WK86_9NEOP|nr:unnamed protein product [Diatraea saccharalis]
MFKSCCARPNKKINKSKSKTEKLDTMAESYVTEIKEKPNDTKNSINNDMEKIIVDKSEEKVPSDDCVSKQQYDSDTNIQHTDEDKVSAVDLNTDAADEDTIERILFKRDLSKKRFSVDYKRSRLDFKRFSVDCRRDSATLEELARLEQELARTNVDVRPGLRRKSSGILKSTPSSSNGITEPRVPSKEESLSDDDEVFEGKVTPSGTHEGPQEPPATPVGRDELALRRHRFFSDLVCAARAAVEHRVRFDPLGPTVADPVAHCFSTSSDSRERSQLMSHRCIRPDGFQPTSN